MHVTLSSPQMVLVCSFFCLAILPSISLCLLIVYFQATSNNFTSLLCLSQVFSMCTTLLCILPTFPLTFLSWKRNDLYVTERVCVVSCLPYCLLVLPLLTIYSTQMPSLTRTITRPHCTLRGKCLFFFFSLCERERCVGNKNSVHDIFSRRNERKKFLVTVPQNCTCTEGEFP